MGHTVVCMEPHHDLVQAFGTLQSADTARFRPSASIRETSGFLLPFTWNGMSGHSAPRKRREAHHIPQTRLWQTLQLGNSLFPGDRRASAHPRRRYMRAVGRREVAHRRKTGQDNGARSDFRRGPSETSTATRQAGACWVRGLLQPAARVVLFTRQCCARGFGAGDFNNLSSSAGVALYSGRRSSLPLSDL